MKKGTVSVKINGREEAYLLSSIFFSGVLFYGLEQIMDPDTAAIGAMVFLGILLVIKVTVLRNWHVREIEWSLDDENLVFDGEVIPRKRIFDVFFKRSKLSRGCWYLTIEANKTIRVESLGGWTRSKQSLAGLSELADALRVHKSSTPPRRSLFKR